MTVRVWHLGAALLLVLALGGFYVTHGTPQSATSTTSTTTSSTPPAADNADTTSAEANVRSLVPSIESYAADNVPNGKNDPNGNHSDSGYTGMTVAIVRSLYDKATPSYDWVNPSDSGFPAGVARVTPAKTTYCAVSKVGSTYAWQLGPTGVVKSSTTPASVCVS